MSVRYSSSFVSQFSPGGTSSATGGVVQTNRKLDQMTVELDHEIEEYLDADKTGNHSVSLLFNAQSGLRKQREYIQQLEDSLRGAERKTSDFSSQSLLLTSREQDLVESKNKGYELERVNKLAVQKHEELKIEKDAVVRECERKLAGKNKEIDDLMAKLRFISAAEAEHKKRADDLELKVSEVERKYDTKVKSLEKARLKAQSEMVELKHKTNESSLKRDMEVPLQSQIQSLSGLKSKLELQVTEQNKKIEALLRELSESNKNYELLKLSSTSGAEKSVSVELVKLSQNLTDSEKINQSLRNENQYLKSQNEKLSHDFGQLKTQYQSIGNIEIIKQQNEIYKDKLKRFEDIVTKNQNLELELERLKRPNSSNGVLNSTDSIESSKKIDELLVKVNSLEVENQLLLGKLGETTSHVKLLENRTAEMTSTLQEEKESKKALELKISQLTDKIKRLEKQNYLFKAERDGMKKILDVFDIEDHVSSDSTTNGTDSSASRMRLERINELERALNERNLLIESYEQKLSSVGKSNDPNCEDGVDYKEENKKLNKEIERLIEEIAIYEARLGRGEYDANKYKVLHMVNNPSSPVGVPTADAQNGSTQKADSALIEENHRLQIQINDFEKKMERLKSVFRQKINEFREAVYSLLGYKIDVENNKYKLISMYSEKEKDFLLFQFTATTTGNGSLGNSLNGSNSLNSSRIGSMELLETEYTKTLDKEVKAYLRTCKSIPSFLSHLTLELFSKTTVKLN